jgi:hypothetical protein
VDDYDRATTLDALTSLESTVAEAPALGPTGLATRLDGVLARSYGTKFVSKWTFELAVRLRQLVCAQNQGLVPRATAEDRYVRFVSDLEDERAVIVDEMRRQGR